MTLGEIKATKPVFKKTCVCFLVHEDNVLLTMKKRGHGEGKWNGFGGKLEADETFEACVTREAEEEISITPKEFEHVATMFFYSSDPKNNWEVRAFIITKWDGLPDESEEVRPEWFSRNDIPYEDMWEADRLWLPRVLSGEKLQAEFLFSLDDTLIEQTISVLE
jgi:8-oxo-dGTP diphosphatase